MRQDDIEDCKRRIAEEERLTIAAGSPEAGEAHAQLVMLYKTQLAVMMRNRTVVLPTSERLFQGAS
jgi:hypothetical protein